VTRTEDEDGRETEKVVIRDRRKIDPNGKATGESVSDAKETKAKESGGGAHRAAESEEAADVVTDPGTPGLGAELEALRTELDERTRDLQRVTAEYANYRKRVERDRVAMVEQATGTLLAQLLPLLDDVERARQHDDLTGAFKTVGEGLEAVASRLGLEKYGQPGEAFDPQVHEAVMQAEPDAAFSVATCAQVFRPGFRVGGRVLRPAQVAVAEPAES